MMMMMMTTAAVAAPTATAAPAAYLNDKALVTQAAPPKGTGIQAAKEREAYRQMLLRCCGCFMPSDGGKLMSGEWRMEWSVAGGVNMCAAVFCQKNIFALSLLLRERLWHPHPHPHRAHLHKSTFTKYNY